MIRVIRILARNSTVNGRAANREHDARKWFDGWKNLALTNPGVYKDGSLAVGCGEYLHVPLANDTEERWYRVRSRVEPGAKLRGRAVKSVSAEKVGLNWFWVIEVSDEANGG